MRYEKPAVVACAHAKESIAFSCDKTIPIFIDCNPILGDTATSPAYEADE